MYALHSRVRYSEADEKGRLSVSGIMNYLQDCCTMQAEDLGVGLSYLAEHHIGWFVTSYQIKLLKEMPMVGESIVVKTWPYRFRDRGSGGTGLCPSRFLVDFDGSG